MQMVRALICFQQEFEHYHKARTTQLFLIL